MISRRTAWVLLLASLLPVAVAPLTTAGSAGAQTSGPCPGASGVTVVVDFGRLGGGTVVRCAPGDPDDGFDALKKAGFSTTRVGNQDFLCKIDRRPVESGCYQVPPFDAYWSYWHAPRGGFRAYSDIGAGGRDPKPGDVEGWAFSRDQADTDQTTFAPRVSPPPPTPPTTTSRPTTTAPRSAPPGAEQRNVAAPSPRPTPTAPPPVTGGGGGTEPAPAPDGVRSATTTPSGEASPSTTIATAPTTTVGEIDAADDEVIRLEIADADEVAGRNDVSGDGAPVGTLVGLAVIAVVGAGAAVALRRRGAGPDG